MKLTEEFYIQANRTVLKALLQGIVTFPEVVKERQIKARKTTRGVCVICSSKFDRNCAIQKYCSDCAFEGQRRGYFRRKAANEKSKTKAVQIP
jgi:hypothetical protein